MGQAWSMLWDVQLPFNCYETTHTWTPHCHQASVDLFASVLLSTLPLHALLYLGSFLTKSAKTSWKDRLGEATRNTLRSSVCVAYCFYFLLAFNCGSRQPLCHPHTQAYLGHYSPGSVLASTVAAMYLGMQLEDPRRVPRLACRLLARNGGLVAVSRALSICSHCLVAQAPVFAIGLAGYFWLSRGVGGGDIVRWALRLLLGAKPLFCKHAQSSEGCEGSMSMCLAVALARFVILGGAGSALSLVLSWGRRLDIRPGLFMGSMGAIYSLAYQKGEASGLLPSASDEASSVLFAICSGVLLTVGVLQPHLVRPSYRAFIDRVSGYRMRFINVPAIATLGYGTTSLVPGGSEIPELNPRFLSRKYTETLWIWSQ